MKNAGKKIAVGTAFAAVAGYVAGILTAPKSGKETRSDIKNTAKKSAVEVEKDLKKLHEQLDETIKKVKNQSLKLRGKAKKEAAGAAAKASKVKEKARQMISAVHEGEAEDQDLGKAVNEASKAVSHLKTFLKKP